MSDTGSRRRSGPPPEGTHRVVVVGGGFGGLPATRLLARSDVDVTLIDRRNHHLFQPLLYQVATGILSPGQIAPVLRQILRKHDNVQVEMAEVTGFDLERRVVKTETIPTERARILLRQSHRGGRSGAVLLWSRRVLAHRAGNEDNRRRLRDSTTRRRRLRTRRELDRRRSSEVLAHHGDRWRGTHRSGARRTGAGARHPEPDRELPEHRPRFGARRAGRRWVEASVELREPAVVARWPSR